MLTGKLYLKNITVTSLNNMYRRKGNKTSPHKKLESQIKILTKDLGIVCSEKKLFVKIHIERKNKREFDLDNALKSIIDCLEGIIWKNDNQIYCLLTTKELNCEENKISIEWEELVDDID